MHPSTTIAGYSFSRKNFFQGRWIRHAGWWPDRVTRLFQKDIGRVMPAMVHESVEVNGTVVALDVPIEHFTESRLSQILLKIDNYSTLGAGEAFAGGKKTSVWSAAPRAFLTFFQDYFLRLGILDGAQGLTLAITLENLAKDTDVRAVIVTGAGLAFSAGGDIKGWGDLKDEIHPRICLPCCCKRDNLLREAGYCYGKRRCRWRRL